MLIFQSGSCKLLNEGIEEKTVRNYNVVIIFALQRWKGVLRYNRSQSSKECIETSMFEIIEYSAQVYRVNTFRLTRSQYTANRSNGALTHMNTHEENMRLS